MWPWAISALPTSGATTSPRSCSLDRRTKGRGDGHRCGSVTPSDQWCGMATGLLARGRNGGHAPSMFCVDETTADAIRRAYEEEGELSAVVVLRRFFPGIADNTNARR